MNIRTARQNSKISQSELASAVGVTQQAVAKWEAGQSLPRADKLIQLARILDITVSDLLTDGGEIDAE